MYVLITLPLVCRFPFLHRTFCWLLLLLSSKTHRIMAASSPSD